MHAHATTYTFTQTHAHMHARTHPHKILRHRVSSIPRRYKSGHALWDHKIDVQPNCAVHVLLVLVTYNVWCSKLNLLLQQNLVHLFFWECVTTESLLFHRKEERITIKKYINAIMHSNIERNKTQGTVSLGWAWWTLHYIMVLIE